MFRKLAILGAALIVTAPVLAAGPGGGGGGNGGSSTSSSSGGGGHGGESAGGGGHAGGAGFGGGGFNGGSLGAHGAAISTHGASIASHAVLTHEALPTRVLAAHATSVHQSIAKTAMTDAKKPPKPHPMVNPMYPQYNQSPYPDFAAACLPSPVVWSDCDRPFKAGAR